MKAVIKPTNLHQLGWLRGLAAALVVLYHIQETLLKPKYFGRSSIPFAAAGNAGVQLFFVLSGFVIYYAHWRDPQGDRLVLPRFVLKRFRRIYPTLWIVLTLLLALQIVAFQDYPGWLDLMRAYTIVPAVRETILAVEWTLRHELLFYAVFMIFLWNRRIGLVMFIVWTAVSVPVAFLTADYQYAHFFFDQNHALFLMGMGVAWLLVHERIAWPRSALASGIALFALAYAAELDGSVAHDRLVQAYGLGTALAICGMVALSSTNIRIASLERAGAASYALYLIHNPLVSIAARLSVAVDHRAHLPLWLYAAATFVLCQAMALVFHARIERPALTLFDRVQRAGRRY